MRRDISDVGQNRLYLLSGLVIFGAAIVTVRLFQKQILEYPQYKAQAERQHITKQEVPAERGRIFIKEEYDQDYPLAMNVTRYQVLAIPKSIKDPRRAAKELAPLLELDETCIFNKINNKKPYIPPIKKHLSKDEAKKVTSLEIAGVVLVPESLRYYPEEVLAAQVVGFLDSEAKGRYGVEGYYDEALRGYGGVMVAERDSRGRYISILGKEVKEQDGADLILSLEHNAQFKAEQVLAKAIENFKADRGTLVALDIKTGGVVAMVNSPSYDPNKYNEVAKDSPDLFRNAAVSEVWEPGSIIKPLVMGAALDKGLVEPDTEEVFAKSVMVQGYEIFTAEKKAFGRETMTQVLENSDNVAMVWLANRLGSEQLFRYMKGFGFGERTGIDLQGEAAGTLPELKKWRDINRATISFGQGMSATPLQVAAAYAAVGNDGVLIKPHIVDTIKHPDGTETKISGEDVRQVLKKETTKKLTDMLISVVEKGHGKKAGVKGYWVAGKTGTAQVPRPEGGYYEDRHIGSFAGFFPADNPRFAMVVKLENPKNTEWAESSAAPTFGEMASWLLSYYHIPPTRKDG